jgi:hypothetical protein
MVLLLRVPGNVRLHVTTNATKKMARSDPADSVDAGFQKIRTGVYQPCAQWRDSGRPCERHTSSGCEPVQTYRSCGCRCIQIAPSSFSGQFSTSGRIVAKSPMGGFVRYTTLHRTGKPLARNDSAGRCEHILLKRKQFAVNRGCGCAFAGAQRRRAGALTVVSNGIAQSGPVGDYMPLFEKTREFLESAAGSIVSARDCHNMHTTGM